jgi:ribosomal protein S18 acetylase RimI-like enzyme
MSLTFFKRYRMEIDLVGRDLSWPKPPKRYHFVAWDDSLLDSHAQAKYRSFCEEIDASVFPCLGEFAGCRRLMREITRKEGFEPAATWLAVSHANPTGRQELCGTIQGLRHRSDVGAVQNLGIVPSHRGCGLGTSLLFQALNGFRESGVARVYLEVTAENEGAIRLYHRLGFVTVKTVYKGAEVAFA